MIAIRRLMHLQGGMNEGGEGPFAYWPARRGNWVYRVFYVSGVPQVDVLSWEEGKVLYRLALPIELTGPLARCSFLVQVVPSGPSPAPLKPRGPMFISYYVQMGLPEAWDEENDSRTTSFRGENKNLS